MTTAADKRQQFVANTRVAVEELMTAMDVIDAIANEVDGEWALLYGAIVTEEDIPETVIPADGETRLQALTTAIANMRALLAEYTGGMRTTFERVV